MTSISATRCRLLKMIEIPEHVRVSKSFADRHQNVSMTCFSHERHPYRQSPSLSNKEIPAKASKQLVMPKKPSEKARMQSEYRDPPRSSSTRRSSSLPRRGLSLGGPIFGHIQSFSSSSCLSEDPLCIQPTEQSKAEKDKALHFLQTLGAELAALRPSLKATRSKSKSETIVASDALYQGFFRAFERLSAKKREHSPKNCE